MSVTRKALSACLGGALILAPVACSPAAVDRAGQREPQQHRGPVGSGGRATAINPPAGERRSDNRVRRNRRDRPAAVTVQYRVERRTSDAATAGFTRLVHRTLADRRGWSRAGFRFLRAPSARYLIVLAEGPEVDRLCLPYETHGTYSCQNGPVVALNADRWRRATPKWTGSFHAYRVMLINHEVGHLLGQHHPKLQCPAPARPAPIMAQQSTELNGCLPNPWPLRHEIAGAARHDQPLAPPFERY